MDNNNESIDAVTRIARRFNNSHRRANYYQKMMQLRRHLGRLNECHARDVINKLRNSFVRMYLFSFPAVLSINQ